MHSMSLPCAACLLLAQPLQAAILYQATLPAGGSPLFFDDFLVHPSVIASGSTWIGISGGTIRSADWQIDGEFTKLWWELIDEDDEGNQQIILTGNDYFYNNGCAVSLGTPMCSNSADFRSRLHNNTVRIDFSAPVSYNRCYPFDGVFNADCAEIYNLRGAGFSIEAIGPGPVTLTISSTHLSGAIPEPASWALLIAGFGFTGAALRRRRQAGASDATRPATARKSATNAARSRAASSGSSIRSR